MCLQPKRSVSEAYGYEVSLEPSSVLLDELGQIDRRISIQPSGIVATVAKYFKGQVISYHDLSEDG